MNFGDVVISLTPNIWISLYPHMIAERWEPRAWRWSCSESSLYLQSKQFRPTRWRRSPGNPSNLAFLLNFKFYGSGNSQLKVRKNHHTGKYLYIKWINRDCLCISQLNARKNHLTGKYLNSKWMNRDGFCISVIWKLKIIILICINIILYEIC